MKVYIKPWEEALKSTKEFDERLVDTINGIDYIIGISHRHGDWGHIVEAKTDSNSRFDYYTTYYKGEESFTYPIYCVEEITPEWLEQNADKFKEEIISNGYDTSFITIYKVIDALNTCFFYVKRVSYNGCEEVVEDFREIK